MCPHCYTGSAMAREFLHKAEMRSAPGVRARFLLSLLRDEEIPYAHDGRSHSSSPCIASCLLWWLHRVPHSGKSRYGEDRRHVLCIVAVVYLTLTLIPLECLDCPYRIPVSGVFWSILQLWKRFRYQRHHRATDVDVESGAETSSKTDKAGSDSHSSMDETMVEAMFRTAWQPSAERSQHGHNALLWTLKSLSDDVELEPFVEAIPDIVETEQPTLYLSHRLSPRQLQRRHSISGC